MLSYWQLRWWRCGRSLSRAALPQETDAELHVFRLAELSESGCGGEWYPRWSPNFYYGYGYPIFN